MFYAITLSALAIAVALAVAIAHIALAKSCRQLILNSQALQTSLRNIAKRVDSTSSAQLSVTVAALEGAVDKLARSMRSQFGQVWGTIGSLQTPRPEAAPADDGERPTRDQLRTQLLRPPFSVK